MTIIDLIVLLYTIIKSMVIEQKYIKATGDWGLFLIRSCNPKCTDTQMSRYCYCFMAFVYLYMMGETTQH